MLNRELSLKAINDSGIHWDIIVIGNGRTLGSLIAIANSTIHKKILVVEAKDFGYADRLGRGCCESLQIATVASNMGIIFINYCHVMLDEDENFATLKDSITQNSIRISHSKIIDTREHLESIEPENFNISEGRYPTSEITKIAESNHSLAKKICNGYRYTLAHVVWSIRAEMATSVEDIMFRRLELSALDSLSLSRVACDIALVAATEMGKDSQWIFNQLINVNRIIDRESPNTKTHTLRMAFV